MKYVAILALTACTTLGPMPATTAVSAVSAGPGVEAQVGAVPGFYLSSSAQDKANGAAMTELGAIVDPGRSLGVPGLVFGARMFGSSQDTPGEPIVGYRRAVSDDLSLAGFAFGATKRSSRSLASYHGARYGAEGALDARLLTAGSWLELHVQGAATFSRIVASGTYCANKDGDAIDCDVNDPSVNHFIDSRVSGIYPAGTMSLAADFWRGPENHFHGARVAMLVTAGDMPLIKGGVQQASSQYMSIGMTLTLGLGPAR
jgi:hypothetical protein